MTLLVCGALSAAVAVPAYHYLLDAFFGCAVSLGCSDDITPVLFLSVLGLLTPFAVFAAGAYVVGRAPEVAAMPKAQRFVTAAAFALLPPVLLLWYLLS